MCIVGAGRDLTPISFSESFQAEEEEGLGGTWAETIRDRSAFERALGRGQGRLLAGPDT